MSGPITVGIGGIAGWKIVQRNEARHVQAIAKDPVVQRTTTYFQEKIGRTMTAEDLVKDYRLLSTALSAFGLESDIANKAFIRKVLESDTGDKKSLVNRLADKRYLKMAEAFGFGTAKPAEKLAATVSQAFIQCEFERRVGQGDETLRFALNRPTRPSGMRSWVTVPCARSSKGHSASAPRTAGCPSTASMRNSPKRLSARWVVPVSRTCLSRTPLTNWFTTTWHGLRSPQHRARTATVPPSLC